MPDERNRRDQPPGSDDPAKKRNQTRNTKPAVITEMTITTSRIWRWGRPSFSPRRLRCHGSRTRTTSEPVRLPYTPFSVWSSFPTTTIETMIPSSTPR